METCKQCGTCCRKGGPALHREDLYLVQDKVLPISSLVTIRKGEPVFSPIGGAVEPAKHELLKVSAANSWICPFLNQTNNHCKIYASRPVECSLLKCWAPAQLKDIIYRNNIDRWDIIKPAAAIFDIVKQHDKECSFTNIEELCKDNNNSNDCRTKIHVIIQMDLSIREQAINLLGLSLAEELFYFGRPMFKSLDYFIGEV